MAVTASGSRRGVDTDHELISAARDLRCDATAHEVRLPNRPEAASAARRLTRVHVHNRWMLGAELTDNAVLLVSELVNNVLQHAGAQTFSLRIRRRRGWVRVEVRDPSRSLPCLLPVGALEPTGRGLCLVNHVSDRWGVDLLPLGKSVWFELRVTG
ncbi:MULTISPECIES: ATP-binding protein [unclassified Streptomyces]|uniref:ATP-binding protein n=1 Tax=unclassified Streptomyces TaxID=2593676 RepID=UPI000CD5AF6C|nr:MULTISPECIES: ATP-binding protein [unclassified Streptomyces]